MEPPDHHIELTPVPTEVELTHDLRHQPGSISSLHLELRQMLHSMTFNHMFRGLTLLYLIYYLLLFIIVVTLMTIQSKYDPMLLLDACDYYLLNWYKVGMA